MGLVSNAALDGVNQSLNVDPSSRIADCGIRCAWDVAQSLRGNGSRRSLNIQNRVLVYVILEIMIRAPKQHYYNMPVTIKYSGPCITPARREANIESALEKRFHLNPPSGRISFFGFHFSQANKQPLGNPI